VKKDESDDDSEFTVTIELGGISTLLKDRQMIIMNMERSM
jgi:hypothetical protein